MKLSNITVLTGEVHEFYSRALWTELIKAGASFTVDVDSQPLGKLNSKIYVAHTLRTKPDPQDSERLLYWTKRWATSHPTTKMVVSIYTPLSTAVVAKINRMIAGSDLVKAITESHESIIPETL